MEKKKYTVVGFGDHPTLRKEGDRTNYWQVPDSVYDSAKEAFDKAMELKTGIARMEEEGKDPSGQYGSTMFCVVPLSDFKRIMKDTSTFSQMVEGGMDEDEADELDDEEIVNRLWSAAVSPVDCQ